MNVPVKFLTNSSILHTLLIHLKVGWLDWIGLGKSKKNKRAKYTTKFHYMSFLPLLKVDPSNPLPRSAKLFFLLSANSTFVIFFSIVFHFFAVQGLFFTF